MKKKILFVIPSLNSGGAEKSLVSLLKLFDYSKYDVDLFVFKQQGLFVDSIPSDVTVYNAGENYNAYDGDIKKALIFFLKKFRFDLFISRIIFVFTSRIKDTYKYETKIWKRLKKNITFDYKKYDCVVGYLEGTADWFAADYPNTNKKIGYMHSYLDKTNSDKKHFGQVVSKFNHFIAVSDECMLNLKKEYTDYDNFTVIENIVSPKILKEELTQEKLPASDGEIKILTVGRIVHLKGLDIAVKACSILKQKTDIKFKWYHIGAGSEKDNILALSKKLSVDDVFVFLGEKSNPYPYFEDCDIYAHPSRYEGKSIAIDEAKCLYKPILVTNYPSVNDQVTDGETAIICEMTPDSVANALLKLISDAELRQSLSDNLRASNPGNESEIQKLYDLIES